MKSTTNTTCCQHQVICIGHSKSATEQTMAAVLAFVEHYDLFGKQLTVDRPDENGKYSITVDKVK